MTSDKLLIMQDFVPAVAISILRYGCTTWMLTKCIEKKLSRNYTRNVDAVLNKSLTQHTTKQQLYCHLPPISQTVQVR